MGQFWRIGDFAKKVGKHNNTVDGWFKQLEDSRIHYVGRAGNEKVYDAKDLQIAEYIRDRRKDKPPWALEAIFLALPEQLELRAFPEEFQSTSESQVFDMEVLKKIFQAEFQALVQQAATVAVQALPSPEQQRADRFNERMAERRVEQQLEKEALKEWEAKPESLRMKKVGKIFKKQVEDDDARDLFIRDYMNEHFESRLRTEYGL